MALILPAFNLQRFNTLASPVVARGYVSVDTQDELIDALQQAQAEGWPILPLGGGSNVILHDDFPGLVIHINLKGQEVVAEDDECIYLKVAAGENWHDIVVSSLHQHMWGLENLSLIPGSVGAAPIQNIGAYGVELETVFYELTAIDIVSKMPITFTREACDFSYRNSAFKQHLKDRYIIIDVTFKLNKIPNVNLSYPALQDYLISRDCQNATPQEVSDAVCALRRSKLPDPAEIPNVGSFFKNPIVSATDFERIKRQHPHIVAYPVGSNQMKLAAAWLIDQAGWKGHQSNGVAVHTEQALVLTNPAKLCAREVLLLATKIQVSVQEKYGVTLEIEPRLYP